MKRFFIFVIAAFITSMCVFAQSHRNFTYKKTDWGKIPSTLTVHKGGFDEFTRCWEGSYRSADGKVKLEYFQSGYLNTGRDMYSQDCRTGKVTLKVFRNNYYVVSGTKGSNIFYIIAYYSSPDDSFLTRLCLTYPQALKQYYNPACKVLLDTCGK